ncbi:MAG: ParB/RepB/Spo0J family partition protein [Lachnospiraceae bacterium]|nr:ParB/RepB/Spo0J family partition protein [Lachnospiraceae bacterium]
MKSSAKNTKLASVDDLFKTDEGRADDERERVQEIAISELHPFKDHPFKVVDDEKMMETVESVQQYGVLVPIIARPLPRGEYEIVSGHRRHRACELAGKETMPVIVRDLDDDEAVLLMMDSNLQRETILPSERAFAFKMKMDAIKHQGSRADLTSRQVGEKLQTSIKTVAEQANESQRQVQRYIRLTELIPPLLDMVDEKKIAFNPAYELSFLKPKEQEMLIETMDYEQATPSLSQAQRLKQFSQDGRLTEDSMLAIMSEEKKPVQDRVMFTSDVLRQYFPKDYTPRKMEETIIQLLEQWKQKRQMQQKQQQKKRNLR